MIWREFGWQSLHFVRIVTALDPKRVTELLLCPERKFFFFFLGSLYQLFTFYVKKTLPHRTW